MKPLRTVTAILITAVLLAGLLPAASAADGESVLTSVGHASTNTVAVSSPSAAIELTVPFSYPGTTVELSNNLTIAFDAAAYKHVVATPSGPATVGGAAVTLNVSYNRISEAEGAAKWHTRYSVKIVRAEKVLPAFAGTVVKETTAPGIVMFIASDFTSKYTRNDGGEITAICIRGSNPSFGSLKLDRAAYVFGTPVGVSTSSPATSVNLLSFTATAIGSVTYDVFAYAGTDMSTPIGNVVLTIHAVTVPTIKTAVTDTATKGSITRFTPWYFTDHCDMNGVPLVSVEITPTNTIYGVWSLNGTPFSAAKIITAADLDGLAFTATAPGTAAFNWRLSNKAGFSATGSGTITVVSPALTLEPSGPDTPILKGLTYTVQPTDFKVDPAYSLSYIKLTGIPASSDGYLYLAAPLAKNDAYGYPALLSNKALAANAIIPAAYLGNLRLATKTTSASSQISFKWTATADLKVTSATWAEQSTFAVSFISGGTLPYQTDMNVPLPLSAPDLSNRFLTQTGLSLSYVVFALPDKTAGTLYTAYDPATKKGTAVTAAIKYYTGKNPNLAGITFVPAADYTGMVTVTYNAYADSGATIAGTITIRVVNSSGGTVNLQTDKNSPLQFDAAAFQSAFQAAAGKALSYVVFTLPSSTYGTLYYNADPMGRGGSPVAQGSAYYMSTSPYLSMVTYIPAADVTGPAAVTFTGYAKDGSSYYGKAVITVIDSPAGVVSYALNINGAIALSGPDFSDEFVSTTGSLLSYVTFTPPPATMGFLYEKFDAAKRTGSGVSAAKKYCDGRAPDISGLTFVPAKDFVGTVTVAYKAYTSAGTPYVGKLKFIVSGTANAITYETVSGSPVAMNTGGFANAFFNLSNGKSLASVSFELPSAACGRLYYNYTSPTAFESAVTAGTKYFIIEKPYISGVSFVPADGYSGTCSFLYVGTATDGTSYSGSVRITVRGTAVGIVSYMTDSVTPVTFSAADFSWAYYGGGALSYILFTPPEWFSGSLVYGYSSASSPGTAVSASTMYYIGSWPSVSDITFIPAGGYSGTLTIPFTAYNTAGTASSGAVVITVKSNRVEPIRYTTPFNTPVRFGADDFDELFLSSAGQSLNYVVFSLPPTDTGRLVLGSVTPVAAGVKYYLSFSPLLSEVSFVPGTSFTGTVTIAYTGYTSGGAAYGGDIIVDVGPPTQSFSDMRSGFDWAVPAVSYLTAGGIVKGADDGNYHPADNIRRCDFVLMVARAFDLTAYSSDNFTDVPLGAYYYSALAAAKQNGILISADGTIRPTENLTRQDAVVILSRTLSFMGVSLPPGSAEDLAAFPDAASVPEDAVPAFAALVNAGVVTGADGYLKPQATISRAEMAVILYRALMQL